jgi:hypothetical protein
MKAGPRLLLLLLAALTALPGALLAQCPTCNGGDGPVGIAAPGIWGAVGQEGCGLFNYYSEQERELAEGCKCCYYNWEYQHHMANALTPRFAPRWQVHVDALFLGYDKINDIDFASFNPGRGRVLGTDDLGFELEGGYRALAAYSFSDALQVEAVYFGQHDFGDSQAVRDPGGRLFSPFTEFGIPPMVGLDFNNFASISFTSELNNAEFNIRHRTGVICGPLETSILYGVRYTRIDETFNYFTQSAFPGPGGATNTMDVRTNNELIGFQLGVLAAYRVSNRWWFEFDSKFAACRNLAEQRTVYTNTTQGVTSVFTGQRTEGGTAFLGSIDLATKYAITPELIVQGGYYAMGIESIALASENFQTNTAILQLGPADLHDRGAVIYHGPYLGGVFSF